MIYKFAFHDIIQVNEPFGEKTFVFSSDFYQVLLVILHASCADIISASLC